VKVVRQVTVTRSRHTYDVFLVCLLQMVELLNHKVSNEEQHFRAVQIAVSLVRVEPRKKVPRGFD
jgi:hypothetical protein